MSGAGTGFEPRHPRAADREMVRKALLGAFPENEAAQLEEYGDGLVAIAEALDSPFECLRFWIHDQRADKDFSLNAWRRFCALYAADRERASPEAAAVLPAAPEDESRLSNVALCTNCYASVVQQIDGHWWCSRCGVVQR